MLYVIASVQRSSGVAVGTDSGEVIRHSDRGHSVTLVHVAQWRGNTNARWYSGAGGTGDTGGTGGTDGTGDTGGTLVQWQVAQWRRWHR